LWNTSHCICVQQELYFYSANFLTTIWDIIVNSPNHTTLETAVLEAGLVGALSALEPLTVFAPTDAAFAALPSGTLESLLMNPAGDLTTILLYHATSSPILSSELSNGQSISTLIGEDLTVQIDTAIFINNAKIIVQDIIADNGIVHVIDAVLIPSSILSVSEVADSFHLFPNPADETLFIQSEFGFNQWMVRDMQGRVVLTGNNSSVDRIQIPVSALEAGCYFIQMEYNTNIVNLPFIKR
jgi:uncharacterized surface protein with fasciclin (FAS1) repeats